MYSYGTIGHSLKSNLLYSLDSIGSGLDRSTPYHSYYRKMELWGLHGIADDKRNMRHYQLITYS